LAQLWLLTVLDNLSTFSQTLLDTISMMFHPGLLMPGKTPRLAKATEHAYFKPSASWTEKHQANRNRITHILTTLNPTHNSPESAKAPSALDQLPARVLDELQAQKREAYRQLKLTPDIYKTSGKRRQQLLYQISQIPSATIESIKTQNPGLDSISQLDPALRSAANTLVAFKHVDAQWRKAVDTKFNTLKQIRYNNQAASGVWEKIRRKAKHSSAQVKPAVSVEAAVTRPAADTAPFQPHITDKNRVAMLKKQHPKLSRFLKIFLPYTFKD
jgi:hypothetical protein